MTNKILGWILIVPLSVLFLSGAFGLYISDGYLALLGAVVIIAGIWAGIRLIKSND